MKDLGYGLQLSSGRDGTWLHFATSNGKTASLNIEALAETHPAGIIRMALRGWCEAQQSDDEGDTYVGGAPLTATWRGEAEIAEAVYDAVCGTIPGGGMGPAQRKFVCDLAARIAVAKGLVMDVEAAANESVSRGYLVKIEDLRAILQAATGGK